MMSKPFRFLRLFLIISGLILGSIILTTVIYIAVKNKTVEPQSVNSIPKQTEKFATEPAMETTLNGVYSYFDETAELEITISDGHWSGKTIMKSGFGSAYDEQNATLDNGVVKEGVLYDDSGMVKIGEVSDGQIRTSVARQRVTLTRM